MANLKRKNTIKFGSALRPTKKAVPSKGAVKFSKDELERLGREYSELREQIKVLTKKKDDLAIKIKEGAERYGTKDDKGSYFFDSGDFILGRVAKVSLSIEQEKAVKVLEALGLGDVVDVETIKTVNEDKLEKAVSDKRCTLSTVQGFTKKTISYQVSVEKKEEMPEVEQSTLSAAKRK